MSSASFWADDLGVGEAELGPVETHVAPRPAVAAGLAVGDRAVLGVTPAAIARALDGKPEFARVPSPAATALDLTWWNPRVGVLVVEGQDALVASSGDVVVLDDDRVVLAWGRGDAAVRVRSCDQDFVLRVSDGTLSSCRLARVQTAPPAWLTAPRELAPEPPDPAIAAPRLDVMVAGSVVPDWLPGRFARLADSGVPGLVAAAVGMVLRFHLPASFDPSSSGPTSTTLRARAFAAALEEPVVDALVTWALDEVGDLEDMLSLFDQHPAEGDELGSLASGFVRRRDELQSLSGLLALIGRGRALDHRLGELDDESLARYEHFLLHVAPDDHLDEVAWREPDAWWGRLSCD
ncbi:MAG: hypothetical protein IT374_00815 [Polyangiaceae bacterium]|nr:hypothetical protein [Polyangiaceae bacterium]